jgi:hypothetical protein
MLTYGEITRDPAKLPVASLNALLARGFTHFLGNEQASKVVGRIRTEVATSLSTPEKEVNQADVTKEQVQSFRAANAETVAKWTQEVVADALKALDEGKVGIRAAAGPRVDPITNAMNGIARSEVVTILKSNGLKTPKGDEVITFGEGVTRTMAQMIAKRLADHGERIRKEAEKHVAEAARKRAKIEAEAKSAASTGGKSPESLGL